MSLPSCLADNYELRIIMMISLLSEQHLFFVNFLGNRRLKRGNAVKNLKYTI